MSNIFQLLVDKDCEFRGIRKADTKAKNPEEYVTELIKTNISEPIEIQNGIECPKCNKKSAFKSLVQLRASDEASDTFLRCTNSKCKFVKKL